MALPKEPRQKMINIMYLVLTALLALNVSSEILNAFKTVDKSLQKSSEVANISTATYMTSLQEKMNKPESRDKASIWLPKAQEAQQLSNTAYKFIQNVKDSLLRAADFNPAKNGDSAFKEDNLDISTRIMVEGGYGKQLYQQLSDFRTKLLNIDPAIKKEFNDNLPIDLSVPKVQNPENKTFEAAYFRMTPIVAALTMLSKFQNDVKSSENKVIEFCHKQVGQVEVVFDSYTPIVGSSATYLMDGQELEITAGLGAFNSQKKPTVTINGAGATVGPDGLARQKFVVSGVGSKTVSVTVNYTDQNGVAQTKTVPIQYVVGSPTGASVSADAVKVLYIGVVNPISVYGGNVGDEKVHPSIDNGTITKGDQPGKYNVEPSKPGLAHIVLNIDGQQKSQSFDFKVKSIPDPVAKVGNSKGGPMRVNDFKAQMGVRADLENFVFENLKFNVTSYTIVFQGNGFLPLQYRQVEGNSFESVRDLIEKVKPGTAITIDEIRASGPGGTRTLPPIQFNLQ
ncbi:MAG TPA: gliding motility protein GldM [Panacibacter sp.]|nr:gliding motility protein GldM [Panacibacter sp.]HNP44960.1 gliding motility protein GldM [Panacibacter sp.]